MRLPIPKKEFELLRDIVANQVHWELSRNLLANFYHQLALMAFNRDQMDIGHGYVDMANRVLTKGI